MDGTIDIRFSDPDAGATPWDETAAALARAALYWITIVRADGRPHVTPLIGVWHDARCTSAPACANRTATTWCTTTASR